MTKTAAPKGKSLQGLLPIQHPTSLSDRDFQVTESNREAWERVLAPHGWGANALRLLGPTGSGRSHLGAIFLRHHPQASLIDNADQQDEQQLFHRLNALRETSVPLLLAALPGWAPSLPDLSSRWNALPLVTLSQPDDVLLRAVLEKTFSDKQLRVSSEVIDYLERRIERSLHAVAHVVDQLDAEALLQGRPIHIPLVREILEQ